MKLVRIPETRIWQSLGPIRPMLQGFYGVHRFHERADAGTETVLRGACYAISEQAEDQGAGIALGVVYGYRLPDDSIVPIVFDTWPSLAGEPRRPASMQYVN